MRLTHTALIIGALATTIIAAPTSMATPAPLRACLATGAGSRCQWLGNIKIANPQPVIAH